MIDTTALTALISASRAEVAQNSIWPEKVEGADDWFVRNICTRQQYERFYRAYGDTDWDGLWSRM